jgi:autotransporter-associated beta strand protein
MAIRYSAANQMMFRPVVTRALRAACPLRAILGVCLGVLLFSSTRFDAVAYTAADAQVMVTSFNDVYYFTNGNRGYFRNTTEGGTTWFWGRANQMEMLIDLYEQTTNSAYLTQFSNLYNGFVHDYGSNWIWNEFNDDIMWMVIACSRAYQKTGFTTYRNVAKSNFDSCYARAWSTNLGGGLWWKSPLNTSKNACVNGPGAIAAYLIFQNYGDSNYLATAESLYQWERATLVDTNTGRVYDSINISGVKDMTPITYNQGTFIGAANFLGYTNDAILAANYTRNSMGSGGQLPNYEEDSDLGGFNGIFVRWVVKFMNERGLQNNYQLWLQQNANAAWNVRRQADNLSWSKWWDQTPDGARYSFGGWGSVLVMNLLPPTQNPDGGTVTLNASDASGSSSFESALNWSDGAAPSAAMNYLVASARTLRTPQDGSHHTFAGSSLTLSNGATLAFKNTSSDRYVSIGTDLFLDGGEVHNWAGNSAQLGGKVTLRSGGGKIDPQGNSTTIRALIGGPGMLRVGATASSPLNGTLTLTGVNTYSGGTVIEAPHTVRVSGAGTLGSAAGSLSFSNTAGRGYGTFNLNGTNLTVGNLNGLGGTIQNSSASLPGTLTIGYGDATGGNFGGVIANGSGMVSVVKTGSGSHTIAGGNTFTGPTRVAGGTLTFGLGGSGRSSALQVEAGAFCRIATSLALFSNTPPVTLAAGSQLYLTNGVNQSVGYLICGGTIQPAGTWGSSNSTAANKSDLFFGGAGVLTVGSTLAPPAILTATPGNGVVNLAWTASSGATSYNVKRAAFSGGPYTTIAPGVATTNYSDTTALNGVTYFYVVTATSALGESVNSSEVDATPAGPPPAPTGLVPFPGTNQVLLSWNVAAGATGYRVKRATSSGGTYALVGTTAGTGFTDTGLVNDATYYYVVSATNAIGESTNSSEVSARPGIRGIVRLLGSDLNNNTSFNAAGNWSNAAIPGDTNDYFVATNFALRTPTSGSHTFAGGTLTVKDGGILGFKTGGTITVGTNLARALTLDGGWVGLWVGGPATLAGNIVLQAGGGGVDPQANSPLILTSQISGPGFLKLDTAPGNAATGGTMILTTSNSYAGGTVIDANLTLKLTNAATLGAVTGSLAILNTNGRGYGTLDLNGTSQGIGNLTGTGGKIVNNRASTTSVLTIGHGGASGGVYSGTISNGLGTLALVKTGVGTLTLAGTNAWTGGTTIDDGALQLGDGTTRNSSLMGNITNHATLILANPLALTFTNHVSGPGALIKSAAGLLTLSGANTYAGNTTISAGTLALTDSSDISSSASVEILAGATLDVSGRGDHKFMLGSGQSLSGSGIVAGTLDAVSGSTVNPGSSLGTLTVSENASFAGLLLMELNRTNVQNCDQLDISGNIAASGTLTVTNVGSALQAGDTFQLFNTPVIGFAAVNLPELAPGLVWANHLAMDGSLAVVPAVSTVPANITATFTSGTLTLSWPADHTGWRLQVQTNVLTVGLSTNWVDVAASTETNEMTLPIGTDSVGVFFRLVYP